MPPITLHDGTLAYLLLDPLQLLDSILKLQDQLWPLAYLQGERTLQSQMSRPGDATPDHSQGEPTDPSAASIQSGERFYRRTKKKRPAAQGKRWWRTRPDPFAEVWEEMERQLEKTPYAGAKALFQELQHRCPGRFPDGQLRTFQRRVKAWRIAQANKQNTAEMITEPFSGPENGELG